MTLEGVVCERIIIVILYFQMKVIVFVISYFQSKAIVIKKSKV